MAIWQFHIHFIPKQALLDKYGQAPPVIDFENALTINWWLNVNLDISDAYPLLQQFGDLQEWTSRTEGLRGFGNNEGNDILVCYDSKTGRVEELSGRIDLRQIDMVFIDKILLLATQFDCLLLDTKGRLFQPTNASLLDSIQDSNAHRFVTDPKQFLDDLSEKN